MGSSLCVASSMSLFHHYLWLILWKQIFWTHKPKCTSWWVCGALRERASPSKLVFVSITWLTICVSVGVQQRGPVLCRAPTSRWREKLEVLKLRLGLCCKTITASSKQKISGTTPRWWRERMTTAKRKNGNLEKGGQQTGENQDIWGRAGSWIWQYWWRY
jgi:hypothetical protein